MDYWIGWNYEGHSTLAQFQTFPCFFICERKRRWEMSLVICLNFALRGVFPLGRRRRQLPLASFNPKHNLITCLLDFALQMQHPLPDL